MPQVSPLSLTDLTDSSCAHPPAPPAAVAFYPKLRTTLPTNDVTHAGGGGGLGLSLSLPLSFQRELGLTEGRERS